MGTAPAVYRPDFGAPLQRKAGLSAPPVYRPAPLAIVAPAVYRPGFPTPLQPKSGGRAVQARPLMQMPANPQAVAKAGFSSRASVPPPVASRPAASVLQRMKGDEDDYVAPWEKPKKKQLRFNFLKATPENVIRATAHQTVNFDTSKYNAVFTCRSCGMMLAYENKAGKFILTNYVYMSRNKNLHDNERALQLDHYPEPWADRLVKFKKDKVSYDDQRKDYQDESRLRAICCNCNESHSFEYSDIPDYDSDDDNFDPPKTPQHETQYNTGLWSGYRDPNWLK